MTKKQQVIQDIQQSNKRLLRAWKLLKELNEDGKQFDFVNAPELSELASCLKSRADLINDIVYQ